jgi:MFS family permease
MTGNPPDAQRSESAPAGRFALLVIFLTVFIDLLGFGIVIPLLPIYSEKFGASPVQLGLVFSCFSGMQFLFAPMWGRISDRIGRKPVLVGCLFGSAAAYALFSQVDGMMLLIVARLLAGFFGANISTAVAYIADVTTPANRAKGMGLVGMAFGLGFTVGPYFGGKLNSFSPHLPGFVAAGLSLTAALIGLFFLIEAPRAARAPSRVFGLHDVRRAFGDARIGTVLLLSFLAIFAFGAFESMFIYFGLALFPTSFGFAAPTLHPSLTELNRAAERAGLYLFAVGMISALIQGGLIRRLVPRFGETRLIVAGPLILALGLFIVSAANAWWLVIVGCVVMPMGFGLNNPSLTSLVSRASPEAEQGAFLGINQSLLSLARVLGPVCAGASFQYVDARAPFAIAGCVLVIAGLIARWYHARYAASFVVETVIGA